MEAQPPASEPDEEKHEMPWFNLGHLDIPRSAVEGKSAEVVLQVICRALADATFSSLADISRDDERGFILTALERTAVPFVPQPGHKKLPPLLALPPETAHETARALCLLLSANGPVHVDGELGGGLELPVAAERLWMDGLAWMFASEAWAALSFAKHRLKREPAADRFVLEYDAGKLVRARFLFDVVEINPRTPDRHVPDMSQFHELVKSAKGDAEMAAVLRAAYGIELWPLRALFRLLRERATGEYAGQIGVYSPAALAQLLRDLFKEPKPALDSCRSFIDEALSKWTDDAKAYRDQCKAEPWLSPTPRPFAVLPVLDQGKAMAMMCASASDMTLAHIGHDALRGGVDLPPDVAELRRRWVTRNSKHLAWYQLELAGIGKPANSNKVFETRYACYVAEGKKLAGVNVPTTCDDLDLVVFDHQRKHVTVCECKYATAAVRTPEYRDEFDRFDQDSGEIWRDQLRHRVTWVRDNLHQMKIPGWNDNLTDWTVEGCILTNIAPRALLAAYGDLPGTRAIGSPAALELLFG